MTVLVTGGAGYIGGHTVRQLVDQGEQVVVLDNLSTGQRSQVPYGALLIAGDAGDTDLVRRLVKNHKVESIMHFAGSIKVEESVTNPLKYYRNNVEASRAVLEAAVAGEVKCFIFSSSAAVYGNPGQVPVPEDAPLAPTSPYGWSKLMTEQIIRDTAKATPALRFVVLRYFNVAGADPQGRIGYPLENQPPHLIKAALAAATGRTKGFQVFGTDYPTLDGTAVRDFIHVSDLAEAHVQALHHLRMGRTSATLNCGYGKGYSVLEVIGAVQRVSGMDFPLTFGPRRAGDVASVIADVSRMRTILPRWQAKFGSLDIIVEHQLNWEREWSKQKAPAA